MSIILKLAEGYISRHDVYKFLCLMSVVSFWVFVGIAIILIVSKVADNWIMLIPFIFVIPMIYYDQKSKKYTKSISMIKNVL